MKPRYYLFFLAAILALSTISSHGGDEPNLEQELIEAQVELNNYLKLYDEEQLRDTPDKYTLGWINHELNQAYKQVKEIKAKISEKRFPGKAQVRQYSALVAQMLGAQLPSTEVEAFLSEVKEYSEKKENEELMKEPEGQSLIKIYNLAQNYFLLKSSLDFCVQDDDEEGSRLKNNLLNASLSLIPDLAQASCTEGSSQKLQAFGPISALLPEVAKIHGTLEWNRRAGNIIKADDNPREAQLSFAQEARKKLIEEGSLKQEELESLEEQFEKEEMLPLLQKFRREGERDQALTQALKLLRAGRFEDLRREFPKLTAAEARYFINLYKEQGPKIDPNTLAKNFLNAPYNAPIAYTEEEKKLLPQVAAYAEARKMIHERSRQLANGLPAYGEMFSTAASSGSIGFLQGPKGEMFKTQEKAEQLKEDRKSLMQSLAKNIHYQASENFYGLAKTYRAEEWVMDKFLGEISKNSSMCSPRWQEMKEQIKDEKNRPADVFTTTAAEGISQCLKELNEITEKIYLPTGESTATSLFNVMSSNPIYRQEHAQYEAAYYEKLTQPHCHLLATETMRNKGLNLRRFPKDESIFSSDYVKTKDSAGRVFYKYRPYDIQTVTADLVKEALEESTDHLQNQMRQSEELFFAAQELAEDQKLNSSMQELMAQNPVALAQTLLENPALSFQACDVFLTLSQARKTQKQRDENVLMASIATGGTLTLASIAIILSSGTLTPLAAPLAAASMGVGMAQGTYDTIRGFQDAHQAAKIRQAFIAGGGNIANLSEADRLEFAAEDAFSRARYSLGLAVVPPTMVESLSLGLKGLERMRQLALIEKFAQDLASGGKKLGDILKVVKAQMGEELFAEFMLKLSKLPSHIRVPWLKKIISDGALGDPETDLHILALMVKEEGFSFDKLAKVSANLLGSMEVFSGQPSRLRNFLRFIGTLPEDEQSSIVRLIQNSNTENRVTILKDFLKNKIDTFMKSREVSSNLENVRQTIAGLKKQWAQTGERLKSLYTLDETLSGLDPKLRATIEYVMTKMNDPDFVFDYLNQLMRRSAEEMILGSGNIAHTLFNNGAPSGTALLRAMMRNALASGTPIHGPKQVLGSIPGGKIETQQTFVNAFKDGSFLVDRFFLGSPHGAFTAHGFQKDLIEEILKAAARDLDYAGEKITASQFFQQIGNITGEASNTSPKKLKAFHIWTEMMDSSNANFNRPEVMGPIIQDLGAKNEVVRKIFQSAQKWEGYAYPAVKVFHFSQRELTQIRNAGRIKFP